MFFSDSSLDFVLICFKVWVINKIGCSSPGNIFVLVSLNGSTYRCFIQTSCLCLSFTVLAINSVYILSVQFKTSFWPNLYQDSWATLFQLQHCVSFLFKVSNSVTYVDLWLKNSFPEEEKKHLVIVLPIFEIPLFSDIYSTMAVSDEGFRIKFCISWPCFFRLPMASSPLH